MAAAAPALKRHAVPASGVDERLLTPMLRRLVRAIGLPHTLTLLAARGGVPLEIPKRGRASPLLVELIGADHAERLADEFAGVDAITLPMADKLHAQIRNRAIRAERATASLSALARRYGLTRRQIVNIAGDSAPEPAPDLFDGLDDGR